MLIYLGIRKMTQIHASRLKIALEWIDYKMFILAQP